MIMTTHPSKLLDFFIRQTAKLTLTDEKIVETIIKDSWQAASTATQQFTEVEVANIGTFHPYPKKVLTRLKFYQGGIYKVSAAIAATPPEDPRKRKLEKIMTCMQDIYEKIKVKTHASVAKYLAKQKEYTGGDHLPDYSP